MFFLSMLMIRMMWSGHSQNVREVVAKRSLAKYLNNLKNIRETGGPLYHSVDQRKEVLKTDKATQFCKEGATATLMVPWTPNSILAKKLREVVMEFQGPRGRSVKILKNQAWQ